MRTLGSTRRRWAGANTPAAIQKRQRAREAASIAGPTPLYPSSAPLHGDWLGGCVNGHTVVLRLMRDAHHRTDQWAAELDGETVAHAAGLTRLWALLCERFPKALPKSALCSMQGGYTARDEMDAMTI